MDIKRIGICDGGTLIQVTKIASDNVEVTIHQDDSSGAPKTVSWRHEVWGVVVAPFLYKANHCVNGQLERDQGFGPSFFGRFASS